MRGKRKRTNSGGYATVRLKHGQAVNLQELADQLADQEEDTVDGEERLNENIRDMATTLSNKKAIRWVLIVLPINPDGLMAEIVLFPV